MGEEAKQEEVKAETKPEEKVEEKKEEKAAEEKKEETPAPEEKKDEEKKEDEPPKPPAPVILYVDLHCVGCAKKIERSIMKIRGVEGVHIDMATNQVTIKGIIDPQAICLRIQKKIRRSAKIISPLPAAEGEPIPQVVTSQVGGLVSVELNVNMHCEGCALQLKRKILKMRGVQTAETELSTGKVTVTGTMDAERLVDYVYRRTKKQARIVPQPEPEPVKEEEKKEEKKEEGEKPAEEAAKPEENAEKKEGDEKPAEGGAEEEKKGEEGGENKENGENGGENKEEGDNEPQIQYINYEEPMKKMMYYYPPLYVIERVPAPQLFSDENPNACCIS